MKRAALASLVVMVALASVVSAQAPSAPQTTPTAKRLADLHPGEGWQEIDVSTDSDLLARAWNDPAAGCNLASFEIPIPATAQMDLLAESFGAALGTRAFKTSEHARQGESLRLLLSGDSVQGIANLKLNRQPPTEGDSSASLLACYWNQREPERCAAICQHILDNPTTESP